MMEFMLELTTKIYFGENIAREALRQESRWLKGNILVVTTGRSLIRNGYVAELKEYLCEIPDVEEVLIFDRISANPQLEEVEEAVKLGKAARVSVVAGFGGGSALDAAKAAAVGIGTGAGLERYLLEGLEPPEQALPVIAIPTTAGTGSELSRAAIISSHEHHIKAGIRGKSLLPKAAIVDAAYTWTVPKKTTMETGFDVLAHGIESYLAVKANLLSETLSEKAIRTAAENLLLLAKETENHEARKMMSYVSMLMGINLAAVGTCLPHRMQYAVGAETDTSHGAGLMALYPAWIKQEYGVNEKKVKKVLHWMTARQVSSAEEAGQACMEFLSRIGWEKNLSAFGFQETDAGRLAGLVTGNTANDRLSGKSNIIEEIFREALKTERKGQER